MMPELPQAWRKMRGLCIHFSLVALAGCSSTIVSSSDPSGASPAKWTDYASLPLDVRGSVSGLPETQFANLIARPGHPVMMSDESAAVPPAPRRIVIYLNPSLRFDEAQLCAAPPPVQSSGDSGRLTTVTAALCDHSTLIAQTTGEVLLNGQSKTAMRHDMAMITTQLYYTLFPGSNDPMRYYE